MKKPLKFVSLAALSALLCVPFTACDLFKSDEEVRKETYKIEDYFEAYNSSYLESLLSPEAPTSFYGASITPKQDVIIYSISGTAYYDFMYYNDIEQNIIRNYGKKHNGKFTTDRFVENIEISIDSPQRFGFTVTPESSKTADYPLSSTYKAEEDIDIAPLSPISYGTSFVVYNLKIDFEPVEK